ncbi:MAG: hypothetical protein JSV64_01300 [Candidatus Bathyarchaeota archaeon]|nr:MAG: hypothetical protein JSV64_01300 [Candidatus Bathyarchaeota archaeon]
MVRKVVSGIAIALLTVSMLSLAFASNEYPYTTMMPVVTIETDSPAPNTMIVNVTIYHLADLYYPTDDEWSPGEELGPYASGSAARYNYSLGNLFAFDIAFSWNTARLTYVSHVATVGDAHSDGVLHSPVFTGEDTVNATAGTYDVAYTSQYGAGWFNCPNDWRTFFNMTFTDSESGDTGLSLDALDLTVDIVGQPSWVQPIIPYRTELVHDVAARDIAPNKLNVGEDRPFRLNTTVQNQGEFDETIGTITLYANDTVIGTRSATAVTSRNLRGVVIVGDTTGLAKGNYELKAVASTVSGETDTADNTYIHDTMILITLAGDLDGDHDVDIFDIVKMAGAYGTSEGDPKYDAYADIDDDGDVDIFDIVAAAGNYGESW